MTTQKMVDDERWQAKLLRLDKRSPREPVSEHDTHPMGSMICTECGTRYPWVAYRNQAGTAVFPCQTCRDNTS